MVAGEDANIVVFDPLGALERLERPPAESRDEHSL